MAIDKSRPPYGPDSDPDTRAEHCPSCSRVTPHRVALEIREESSTAEGTAKKYSREPYRVTTCRRCGQTTALRMNDA